MADTKISWANTPPHPITFKHEERVPHQIQGVRKVQNGPPYMSGEKISGGQREEGHWVVHHVQGEHHQSSLDHYKDANQ